MQGLRVRWRLTSPMLDGPLPLHLDALVAYAVTQEALRKPGATGAMNSLADDLPLAKEQRGNDWVWKASAVFDDRVEERGMRLWTRKFNKEDWAQAVSNGEIQGIKVPLKPFAQVIDTQRGINKENFQHIPVKYVTTVTAYCVGNLDRLVELLSPESGYIIALGGRRRMGLGTIAENGFEIEPCEAANELWDRRILPWDHDGAVQLAASTRPPYFEVNNIRPSFVRPEVLG